MFRLRQLASMTCFLLLAGAGREPAAAATPKKGPADRFSGSSTTTLIEVPVNVVDRDGNPVRGLTAADFELWDDGRPQPIDGVETIDLTTFSPGRGQAEKAALAMPGSARRRFLLLFDFTFSNPNAVVRAREAARKFVAEGLHPTDLAAVATFSIEQGPRLLVTFTSDRAQLARAVDTLGVVDLTQRGFLDPLRFFYEAPDVLYAEELAAEGANFEVNAALSEHLLSILRERDKAEKSYARNRISSWARVMGGLARSLGATAGRKNVVLFTEGFDGSLVFGRDASRNNDESAIDQQLVQRGQFWLVDQENTFGSNAVQTQLKNMLEEFRRADSLLQVVDLGGLRTETSTVGTERNSEARTVRDNVDALFYLANTTGGTLFEQGNDVGQKLGELLDRSNVTYVLTFYPQSLESDGRFRKLRVRLREGRPAGRGAKLSYRIGYYAPRPYGDLHPLERSLLAAEALQTLAPRREIGLDLLAATFRSAAAKAYVPVVLEIDGRSLLDGQKGPKLGLEVYIYASTPAGEMRDFRTQVLAVDLDKQRAALEKRGLKYYAHLELPPGEFSLRVLVRNSETGKTAVASGDLEVPPAGAAQAELLPPFFFEDGGDWLMLREKAPDSPGAAAELVYPFTLKSQPFVPAARPRLKAGRKSPFVLVAYGFAPGDLLLSARVLDSQGQEKPAGQVELEERTATGFAGFDKLLARFDPQTLEAGEYTLEVTLEQHGGLRRTARIPFVVG